MCKSCNAYSWNNTYQLGEAVAFSDVVTSSQLAAMGLAGLNADKLTDAFPVDGVGDLRPPILPQFLITTDNVPDAPDTAGSSNPVLTVTPPGTTTPIVSTIDTIGDQDFYKVTLTAGVSYEFGMYSHNGGPNAVGLTDPYLEVYAANGTTLLVSADGGADTVYNQANSGFDVLLVYTPTATGTYYINARAFSNSPATQNGDSVGDYQLFVREQDLNDPDIYRPYYEPTEPLYAIDWGTQVNKINQSARNPDGNEGTRGSASPGVDPTENAQGTPIYSNLLDIPALAAAQGKDITGKNVITIYFAKAGDVFASNDPTNPGLPPATITAVDVQGFEYDAVWTSLGQFENVADIVYLEVQDKNHADFIYTSYQGTPGPGISLLGSMSPPDESDEGLAQFNSGDERWNARDLAQGGFSFVTLIHEFGHGHGLAHPHDNGGHSGIMNGVEQETPTSVANYTTGDYELNQGVFTMMSYEDGWQSSPYGNASTTAGYGYLGGLMAFDIAAIQDKYGVNESYNTGNNSYVMKDVNAAGTFYSSIWDGGGTDEIVYGGTRDANIDLRTASLKYEPGGGGWVSYAHGIFGGYTIANGVTIENATSGGGNDTLTGNAVNNVLTAGAGNDVIKIHLGGNDTVNAGDGVDSIYAGAAFTPGDFIDGGTNRDALILQGDYASGVAFGTGTVSNIVGVDSISLFSGANTSYGDTAGNRYSYNLTMLDGNLAAGAVMKVNGFTLLTGENVTFDGSAEMDGAFQVLGGHGVDLLKGGSGGDAFVFGHDYRLGGGDKVDGGGGYDVVYLRGDYILDFTAAGFEGAFTNVESVALLTSQNTEFIGGGDGEFDYSIVVGDSMVATGATMTFNGSRLGANETFIFDGSQESGGHLRILGGMAADAFNGGGGNDQLWGGGGADRMRGYGGADTFRYLSASDSTAAATDQILDFYSRIDLIDLSRIDANANTAGEDGFTFIGGSAFSGTAGELRAANVSGNLWKVEGDVNGDGIADLVIDVTVENGLPLVATDFML